MDKKIVWILGSGFSVPLGGPTLLNLLSRASEQIIYRVYPLNEFPILYDNQRLTNTYKIYNRGYLSDENSYPQMWADAEQYLDYLDAAVDNPNGVAAARFVTVFKSIDPLSEIKFQKYASSARQIVAAECSVFLEKTSPDLEVWQPYIRWANKLNNLHTIITFNYDRVLETLAGWKKVKNGIDFDGFFGLPTFDMEMAQDVKHIATIIKLHGSVDWRIKDSQIEQGESLEALKCDPDDLVIATPGPTKQKMVTNILAPLWNEAEKKLREADVIVFVGYRFPPTDAEARGRLLNALMRNNSPNLKLCTVLGPDDNSDNRRLESLLKYATKHRADTVTVERTNLWAQDFISIYQPEMFE